MSHSQNIDPAEIDKFDAVAANWWDTTGDFKPLHDINPFRLNYIDQRVGGLAGLRVLDVGCGGGILSESMAKKGATVTGIDLSTIALKTAQEHAQSEGVKMDYIETTVEDFAQKHPHSFDVVTCMEMVEHVPDPASVIASCAKLVKSGGHVMLSTISRNPKAFLFAIVGAEYVLNLVPKGTHDIKKFIRPSELTDMARQSGLEMHHITGLHYNPITKRYWLADNVDVNYMMHTTLPDS